jgi:hypothetical protein
MIWAECVRCGYASEYDTEAECRAAMLDHSRATHPNPLPSWIEDDGEVVTRHGMAALNGHQKQEAR